MKSLTWQLVVVSIALAVQAARAQDDAKADLKNMVGVWRGGWPNETTPRYEIVITAEKINGTNLKDGKSLGEGSYTLDAAAKTIDATATADPGRGRKYLGLYSLDGDTLKWCSNNGTPNRPSEMVHDPKTDQFLLVLTRQK